MDLPIIDFLVKHEGRKSTSFHVPGHKNGKFFKRYNYRDFFENMVQMDITEINGSDNLHSPTGIIRDSQEIASEIFKSKETFFLINGSTSGIYSMIMATTSPGDKIIVNRNCHQSVIHACILGELKPIYVYPEIDKTRGIPLGISPEEIERQILLNKDIKVVLITYPTYEGVVSDLKKITEIVHKYDKILLVDEAHGAHLGLSNNLPKPALECGADLVVQSIHKTLPSLTQSSMLHVNSDRIDLEKLKFMLRVHQTSSPSYILMASLEFALMVYKKHGQPLMEELLLNIEQFKKAIENINSIELFSSDSYYLDPTKVFICSKHRKFSGVWLENYLTEKFNIQMELSNLSGVLGITTIANEKVDFNILISALSSLDKLDIEGNVSRVGLEKLHIYPKVEQKCTPRKGVYTNKKKVEFKHSLGLVSGEFIIPYPPGIPLIIPGEVITGEIIEYILLAKKQGINIVGIKDTSFEFIEVII